MAKRGVFEHEKTFLLAQRLGIPRIYAVGVLEVFWHWVAKFRHQGDLTGISPEYLKDVLSYPGDGEALIAALVACRWLDRTKDDRLIVHDWSEHADNAVHARIKKAGLSKRGRALGLDRFADGCMAFDRNREKPVEEEPEAPQPTAPQGRTESEEKVRELLQTVHASQKPEAREIKAEREPRGRPSPPPPGPDVETAVGLILLDHPRNAIRQLRLSEIPASQTTAVLDAGMAEVEAAGCSMSAALAMIHDRIRYQADKVPRDQWRFFKDVPTYFQLREYRLEPEMIARQQPSGGGGGGNAHGKPNRVEQRIHNAKASTQAALARLEQVADHPPGGTGGESGLRFGPGRTDHRATGSGPERLAARGA